MGATIEWFKGGNVDKARKKIFECIQNYRGKNVIYFDGWSGFGVAPVLRSVAEELQSIRAKKTPQELCFDRIIYIDCSAWESRRVMQRKIAEELELGHEIMAMLDKQDEEDDFNGVDHGSRDLIQSVSIAIARTLVYKKVMMVLLNGSDEEIDVNKFGISPDFWDHVILWTFKRRSLTIHRSSIEMRNKLRYTHLFIHGTTYPPRTSLQFRKLLRGEAANIATHYLSMCGIDMVIECCLYELFLQHSFHKATGFNWAAHSPNYWMSDGILEGDETRDMGGALHQEIHWEIDASMLKGVFQILMKDPDVPFIIVKEDTPFSIKRSCRWISITSDNLESVSSLFVAFNEDANKALLERVSSLFVAFMESDNLQCLPYGFLQHCNNLSVLILSRCAFSFVSPPFIRCHRLRFLGLDHCTHDNTSEGGNNNANWAWLQNLWVLDLRYTEWDDILSEEKIDHMTNLTELNIEGFVCWQLGDRLHGKLPYLQRLRIIKPMHNKADTSIINDADNNNNKNNSSLFVNTDLQILDLSGNRDMENLSICLPMARNPQMLILDGCDGLETHVSGLPSSLRSFSLDGYGPTTRWVSSFKLPPKSSKQKHNSDVDRSVIKTSKISLKGCTQLENLFVRGLPNLEELDLSGSAIRILDFETMVINVPGLKRLILLGCEYLQAIKWAALASEQQLELLCVDTRPWRAHGPTRPCLAQHKKSFYLQLHATLTDARLARSLYDLWYPYDDHKNTYFNIHVTSSDRYGGFVQTETTGHEKKIESSSQQLHVEVILYDDAFVKIGDAPMLFFPQPPTQPSDHHVEINDASRGLEGELASPYAKSLACLIRNFSESLHVHDVLTSASMASGWWVGLKWCRIEKCPNLGTVFPEDALYEKNNLQTIWASHLLMARCIWSKGSRGYHRGYPRSFGSLQHLHLRSCPRLRFVLPVWVASFPSLETLHIIHCGNLTHVFVLDNEYPEVIRVQGLPFPKLTTVHLHDLPKLQEICEVKMLAPALEIIRIRGCFGLRRLPTVAARGPGVKKPTVEIEKDVWESLEWDAGNRPDRFEPPVHSRYYRRSRLLRGTVLR